MKYIKPASEMIAIGESSFLCSSIATDDGSVSISILDEVATDDQGNRGGSIWGDAKGTGLWED